MMDADRHLVAARVDVQCLLGFPTGHTGDHHRQQEPSPVEVRAARGRRAGVGSEHRG